MPPNRAAIPNSRNLATKYSCGRSPLSRLQWGAQQLQVLDVVLATTAGDVVVHFQHAERELAATTVASALLLAEQDVLVLAVGHLRVVETG